MTRARLALLCATLVPALLLATGCQTINETVQAAADSGLLGQAQADAIIRSSSAIGKAMEQITPEREYYLGRSVGANVVARYQPYSGSSPHAYLNELGQSLAVVSDRPETYRGYHFLALDSDEVNAFAAPGGFIFVTRGMIRLCRNEDELAAVLAHEIGHIEGRHGLRAISQDRWVSASLVTGVELLNQANPDLGQLTKSFEDVLGGVSDVLFVKGYGRKLETEADRAAVRMLERVGYDAGALARVLNALEAGTSPEQSGFGTTHPQPAARIRDAEKSMTGATVAAATTERQKRFEKFIRAL